MSSKNFQSRYLERFMRLREQAPDAFQVFGDTLLIEKLPDQEMVTQGGIIVASANTHKREMKDGLTHFGLILRCGKGYFDPDTGEDVDLSVKEGDIILINPLAVEWYTMFGNMIDYESDTIGKMSARQVSVLVRDYEKTFEVLNGK